MSKPICPIPNHIRRTRIVLFDSNMVPFWNHDDFHEYTDEQEDDPDFVTIGAYGYVMVGDIKPPDILESRFLKWNSDKNSISKLREFLWSGMNKLQHWYYSEETYILSASEAERFVNQLAGIANWDRMTQNKDIRQTLIIIPNNKYRPHAEVMLRAVNFLQHLEILLEKYHKVKKSEDERWLDSQLKSLGIDY